MLLSTECPAAGTLLLVEALGYVIAPSLQGGG
jgi:hypothetical protein